MNRRTFQLCVAAFVACASIGFLHSGGKRHDNPYCQAGYANKATAHGKTLLMNLGKVFLQESPSSQAYKNAFANLQEFIRGIVDCDGLPYSAKTVVKKCIIESKDMATAFCKMGEHLIKYAEIIDKNSMLVAPSAENFERIHAIKIDETSPIVVNAQKRLTKIIASSIAVIKKEGAFRDIVQAVKEMDNLNCYFADYSCPPDCDVNGAQMLRGFRKSIDAYPWHAQLKKSCKPHNVVLIKFQRKLMKFIFEIQRDVIRTGGYANSARKLGKLILELGQELKKLS